MATLDGKVAIVAGGGTGIGLRLVLVIKALFYPGMHAVEPLHDLVRIGYPMAIARNSRRLNAALKATSPHSTA